MAGVLAKNLVKHGVEVLEEEPSDEDLLERTKKPIASRAKHMLRKPTELFSKGRAR